MKPPICKKILADIPGSEAFNLIPHLLRLEPSFGRSSVTHKPTNPHTDSRIIYNRWPETIEFIGNFFLVNLHIRLSLSNIILYGKNIRNKASRPLFLQI